MPALIGLIVVLLAGVALLALCIAVVVVLVRVLVAVLRVVATLGLAAAIAASIGLGVWAAGADAQPAALMAVLAYPFAVWTLWRRPSARSVPIAPTPVEDEELVVAYAGPVEQDADAAVGKAWEQLATMVPLERTGPLFDARAACVQLLRLAKSNAMDLEIVACAVFVRRPARTGDPQRAPMGARRRCRARGADARHPGRYRALGRLRDARTGARGGAAPQRTW